MSDDKRAPSSLEGLGERLRRARETRRPDRLAEPQSRQFGVAYRVFVEMVAGVLVGGGLGWFFDHLLGTRPWLLIVLLVMGFAAGTLNAYRVTQRIAADAARQGDGTNGSGDAGGD